MDPWGKSKLVQVVEQGLTQTVGDRRRSADPSYSFVGRGADLERIADALRAQDSVGIVLAGPSGVGKTALFQRALADAQAEAHVVRIRGFGAGMGCDYDALNSLLCELDDDQLSNPVLVLRALADLLRTRAQGRPVLLAVDNVELLDAPSAMIVAQLAADGVGKALLTTRHFDLADPSFMALWRKGSIRRLDVEPFSLPEAALLAETELGAPVSGDAVRTVHRLSRGYPGLLRGCLGEIQRQGLLIKGPHAWIIRNGVAVPCREAYAGIVAQIESLGGACRMTSVLVALSGGIPLSVLLRLTDRSAVDALQIAELVTVGRDHDNTVRCAAPVIEAAITASLRGGEAERAYELAAPELTGEDPSWLEPHRRAAWRREAGLPLDAGTVASAAGRLNDDGKYAESLELAGAAEPEVRRDPAVQLQELRARLAQGDYVGAARVVAQQEHRVDMRQEHAVRLLLMEAALSQRGGSGVRPDLVSRAESIASERQGADPDVARALIDEVLVARAEMLTFQGSYQDAADLLVARKNSPEALTPDTLVRIDTLLSEAWSMGMKQLDAVELARSIASFLLENQVTARTRELAYAQIWESHCIAGDFEGARHLRESVFHGYDELFLAPGTYEEVARALTRAYQGFDGEALRSLIPAFDQLQLGDPWGVLPAAAAGIAYCYAKQHDLRPMIDYVRHSEPTAGTPWKVRQIARHFQVLASSHTDSRAGAGHAFTRLSVPGEEQQGSPSLRMFALFRAARLGDQESLDLLSSLAAQLQGPFARLAELYVKGVGSQDCELLITSMRIACTMGDDKLAKEVARHAVHAALTADDKRTLRHVQRHVREVLPEEEQSGDAESRLQGLTRREREIAIAAAAGATNREIAQNMCVSVRTVEGHLYQVYLKLDVGTRAELAELIPAASLLS